MVSINLFGTGLRKGFNLNPKCVFFDAFQLVMVGLCIKYHSFVGQICLIILGCSRLFWRNTLKL